MMANKIDLSSFKCFQKFLTIYFNHIKQDDPSEIEESKKLIREAFPWIFRRSSLRSSDLLFQISEYQLILLMFFYGLSLDLKGYSMHLLEIIIGTDNCIWNEAVSVLGATFLTTEQELYVMLRNMSRHSYSAVSSLPNAIVKYISDFCSTYRFLNRSCAEGNSQLVQTLLRFGVPVDSSALHVATDKGNIAVVNTLMESGAKFYWTNGEGYSAVYIATEKGHVDIVKSFLSRISKSFNVQVKYKNGMTLLHIATKNCHTEVVNLLLEKDFDVDVKSNQGETPMHLACKNGNEKIVSSLMARGAAVNILSNEIKSPLHLAAERNHVAIVEMLLDRNNLDLDLEMEDCSTALHIACRSNYYGIAELLLTKMADIQAKDLNGNTPAHLGAAYGHVAICELLSEFGCLFEIPNHNGERPLHLAVINGMDEVVEFLLFVMSDIDVGDKDGLTALHIACIHGRTNILLSLLSRGAEMERFSDKGYKAIHYAAMAGHAVTVETLMLHGADVNAKTLRGNSSTSPEEEELTALEIATRAGKQEIVNLLS